MTTRETERQFIFSSSDENGEFEFRVNKNCSQIKIEAGIDSFPDIAYININKTELMEIRDIINKVCELHNN